MNFLSEGSYKMMLRDYFVFVYLDNDVNLLRKIARNIQQAKFYSVMGNKKVDISNKEQLVLCIRWVDEDLQVQEDFIGIHKTPNTTADESC